MVGDGKAEEDNKPHGTGTFNYRGATFQGQYAIRMHGKGSYAWDDGRAYEGEWYDGKICGFGVLSWGDGR